MKKEPLIVKRKVAWKYLFSDFIKYIFFTQIWLWQRPKYFYLNKKAKKGLKDPFMIVCNHQGFADPLFVYYTYFTKRIFFMAHQNICQTKFKEWIFRNLLCIPIDPETGSFTALRVLLDAIKAGNTVTVYPEGHINHESDEVKDFKGGASFLALQSGVDVIMMYREKRKHWWQRQRILVGEPFNLKQLVGNQFSRTALEDATKIIFDKELELKRQYQEIVPAKKVKRSSVQVFISPMPFECIAKIKNKQRLEEINSCKSDKTKNEKFYGWKLLEKAFKENYGINMNKLHFKKQDNGKWVCDKYFVSISHSGDLVAVSIAEFPHGIDIQSIDEVNLSDGLIDKVYLEDEKENDIDETKFAMTWGLKECAFKMSDDTGFNPKNYALKDMKNYENHVILHENHRYSMNVMAKKHDVISYHFMSPDVTFEK